MSKIKVKINWDFVGDYLEAGCSGVEIASKLGIHEKTLYERCLCDLKLEFSTFKQQKKESGDAILKKTQFDLAKKKNMPMLIWLGKNRLGQKDKSETDLNINGQIILKVDETDLDV